MDEQFTFDQWRRALQSESLHSYFSSVVHGDQRYGRVIYYPMMVFGKIVGSDHSLSSQIQLSRNLQSILLVSAMVIMLFCLTHWWIRAVGLFLLLSLDNTVYYSTLLKPEPIMIFFISLLFLLYFRFGRLAAAMFFLVGSVFGAKISGLFIAAPFFCMFLWEQLYLERKMRIQLFKSFSKALSFFVAGWIFSVPSVLDNGLELYLQQTFLNISHSDDLSSVSLVRWIELFLSALSPNIYISVLFTVFAFFIFFFTVKNLKSLNFSPDVGRRSFELRFISLIFGCWMFFLGSIVSFSPRPWGMYLYLGVVLFVFNVLVLIDFYFSQQTFRRLKSVFLCLCLGTIFFGYERFISQIKEYSTRTNSAAYLESKGTSSKLNELLRQNRIVGKVAIYPDLFIPEIPEIEFVPYYGPFDQWDLTYDAVVTSVLTRQEPEIPIPDQLSVSNFKSIEQAKLRFESHVLSVNKKMCSSSPCYRKIGEIGTLRIYARAY